MTIEQIDPSKVMIVLGNNDMKDFDDAFKDKRKESDSKVKKNDKKFQKKGESVEKDKKENDGDSSICNIF